MARRSNITAQTITRKNGRSATYQVANRMPKGWSRVQGATTAPSGYSWISNRKSLFGGKRRTAIIRTSALGNSVG